MSDELGWIAVVEDDPIMGESLQRALELEGWRTSWWHTGKEAVHHVRACTPDLVLCDIRLGDMNGEEVFRVANARSTAPPFIFMTAFGQIDQAVSLVRAGASDYLTKPFELQALLQKAREITALKQRNTAEGVLGISSAMRRVEALLRRVAARSLPVLLTGETGAGKEVCARFLHQLSPAASDPFMAVNCAAIPADLLESEVFGHEKGAFSGALSRHVGYAERARGGTLFLDEIGDMPLALQTKMLRFLEERSFHRVGGEVSVPFKARIVCATSSNLGEQVRLGRFREDLFYRINGLIVEVPPLRERQEDIPWLMSRFFQLLVNQSDSTLRGISSMAEDAARTHPWRGNARELRNRVERAVALAVGPWLMPADIFPEFQETLIDGVERTLPLAAVRDAAERKQIEHVLRETSGQMIEAAKRLDISRTTLWEKMRRYGLVAGETNE
jgi:two-component system response regulator HydG